MTSSAPTLESLLIPGSEAEARLRTEQVLGRVPHPGHLIRSTSGRADPEPRDSLFELALIVPELRTVYNSALPYSFNDGALWAGRGHSFHVTGGLRARMGPVSLVLAPEYAYSQNRPYQVIPYPDGGTPPRKELASPWHVPPRSLDLPSRMGRAPLAYVGPGQSSLSVGTGRIAAGYSTETLWWGPGIHNGLVMSSHAAGIPHLFLRARRLPTPLGELDGRWIVGRLHESAYFDTLAANNHRSISGFAVALRPAFDEGLSIGLARAVYGRTGRGSLPPLGSAFDFLRSVGRPGSARPDDSERYRHDQVFSTFARWVFPGPGLESWVEWARFEEPASLRDLLVAPNHSQGYTVGVQWARGVGGPDLQLQTEITYLEPSTTYKERRIVTGYTSASVPQGYTHRGQVVGAAIGPGSSTQWLSADVLGGRWQVGAFARRIRWHEGALATVVTPPSILRHEISVIGGLRGGVTVYGFDLFAELASEARLNYLFQNPLVSLDDPGGVDILNRSLRLVLRPSP